MKADLRPFIFVLGSTASGKSDLALELAEKNDGVIFNCDSVQVYKNLNVGSAKPSETDFLKVPHFLYDLIQAPDEITLGRYLRHFEEALSKIPLTKNVFVVGGTGFYFQGLEKGMLPIGAADPGIMQEIMDNQKDKVGALKLYQELQEKDPESAQKISPQDLYRTARAVEVIRSQKKTMSEIRKDFEANSEKRLRPIFKIGLRPDQQVLESRISLRTQKMISSGLVEEVKTLIDQGLEQWSPMSSVGYKQTLEMIKENKSLSWLQSEIELRTRQLAKKQRTWFKRDSEILWQESEKTAGDLQSKLARFIIDNSRTGSLDG